MCYNVFDMVYAMNETWENGAIKELLILNFIVKHNYLKDVIM